MTKRRKKVLVFDFDGTIVNSMEAFADVAEEVMPKYFPIDRETARRRYLETSGLPFFQQLEVIFPGNPSNKNAAEEFEKKKLENYFEKPLYEDAAETLMHLRQKGIKVVVSSNNFQELVDRFVGQTGITFDMVLGFRPNFAKGRDHFAHIMREMDCSQDELTFVGDSIKDGERASDFGIDFIGKEGIFGHGEFKRHFPKADVIKNLSDLKRKF